MTSAMGTKSISILYLLNLRSYSRFHSYWYCPSRGSVNESVIILLNEVDDLKTLTVHLTTWHVCKYFYSDKWNIYVNFANSVWLRNTLIDTITRKINTTKSCFLNYIYNIGLDPVVRCQKKIVIKGEGLSICFKVFVY